jgi:hypothetical protein
VASWEIGEESAKAAVTENESKAGSEEGKRWILL